MIGASLSMAGARLGPPAATLLGPLDLALHPTGITMVMGANGAGKSLFLRLAHGLAAPDAGSVTWNGQPARGTLRQRGFVFQHPPLMRRSVAANVAFPLQALGIGRADISRRVAAALARTRLTDRAHAPAAQLSGGERQRMALARALVTEPVALLLDEPAASLDPASTAALEDLIRATAGQGVKLLMSTHDIAQARRMADDILFLDRGRIIEMGAAKDFFEAPASQPAQRYLDGKL
ncbi:MAG: ATP-binding cassette domain-containing protein [Pseudomonadota bacterium]